MTPPPPSGPEAARPRRTRGRPRLEDVAAIEERLLSVALGEFVAHGYGGASLTRIVDAAGISKTTLYSRYPSKDALFRATVDSRIAAFGAATALRSPGGPDRLEAGLVAYADRSLEISLAGDLLQINRLVYREAGRFPELGAAAAERTRRGIEQVAGFIAACAAADGTPCRDPRAPAEAFVFMLRGWYVQTLLDERPATVAQRRAWVRRMAKVLLAAREMW